MLIWITLLWRGETTRSTITRLMRFFAAMRRNNFTLNENKTIAAQSHIQVLGYAVGNGIVKPDPDRLSALKEFPAPQCRKSLRRNVCLSCEMD